MTGATAERLTIRAAEVKPSLELDLLLYHCVTGHPAKDGTLPRVYLNSYRYSRYLRAALTLADCNDSFTLSAVYRRRLSIWAWRCYIEYRDDDGVLYAGGAEDDLPEMAICRAVLELYGVEVVP